MSSGLEDGPNSKSVEEKKNTNSTRVLNIETQFSADSDLWMNF